MEEDSNFLRKVGDSGVEAGKEEKLVQEADSREEKEEKYKGAEEGNVTSIRTPVRVRVQKINKLATGSPGKVPEWKQMKLSQYFGRKSPKAEQARADSRNQPESTEVNTKQGAISPLSGDSSKPGTQELTSKGPAQNLRNMGGSGEKKQGRGL